MRDACPVVPDTAMWLIAIIRWCGQPLLPSRVPESFVRRCGGYRDLAWRFEIQEGTFKHLVSGMVYRG
jgi:hypothetical protein